MVVGREVVAMVVVAAAVGERAGVGRAAAAMEVVPGAAEVAEAMRVQVAAGEASRPVRVAGQQVGAARAAGG